MWRYRWLAMTCAWIVCVIGWITVYDIPNKYAARAKVFVDAQSRLANIVETIGVAPGVAARVFVVRQAMLGRSELEKVAAETGLDLRAQTDEERDSLITGLTEKITISSGRRNEARDLYTITFEDRDRDMAVAVVKTLLDTFVEDVLEMKEQGSEEVTGYLDDQLTHYANLLSASESRLAEFKKKYVGLLPGEGGGIFERLRVEMDLVKQLRLDLKIETDRRVELRRQLQSENPYLPEDLDDSFGIGVPGSPTELVIKEYESRRAELLLVYTERHPDVIAVQGQLDRLYRKREDERAALASRGAGMEGALNATNPVYQSAQIALNESGVKIAGLSSQITQREAFVRELRNQVDTIPEVEAEYAQLMRDYDQFKGLYSEIMLKKERERLGNVGDERDVVRFNIIEPPAAGLEPVSPKRTLLLIVVLILGLATGAGVAYIMHQLHPVFHDVNTLRHVTGRPVLGAVDMALSKSGRALQRAGMGSFVAAGTGLLVIFISSVVFQDLGHQLLQTLLAR